MLSVQRLKELFATLRFRLVLWITLIVFLMVLVTNLAVREAVSRTVHSGYDQFLESTVSEVKSNVKKYYPAEKQKLYSELEEMVRGHKLRGWFVQIFDRNHREVWPNKGTPPQLPATVDSASSGVPFTLEEYRVVEIQMTVDSDDSLYIRCGFLEIVAEEDIDLLNRTMLIASLSILLAAPLGGYIIALRATRPISQIIHTTAQLQPSNMNERLPIRGTRDEIDQLSQTINGMLDRLASYINQNRDFVANAAHELRSPLAAIRSSVEVGLNRSRSPEEYSAILADVMEEIGRLVGLVNRLLILAEGDAGRIGEKKQYARLDKIVRESVDMFDAVADASGIHLVHKELSPVLVPGDETYLRQVVRNLIDNAIKYNKPTGEVMVQLGVDDEAREAVLVVKDTGVGIDRDMLPRIFERFYRADKARSRAKERQGYGLGLSICQAIVHGLNGKISVESESGQGSTFMVRLPIADAANQHQSSDRMQALPASS